MKFPNGFVQIIFAHLSIILEIKYTPRNLLYNYADFYAGSAKGHGFP